MKTLFIETCVGQHGEEVMLIDFNWSGKVSEAWYPQAWLCAKLTDGREGTNPKGDDERVLNNTIKQLKDIASNVTS
jgi:hypothetical protein